MTRISECFAGLRGRGERALVCYMMAGAPRATERAARALLRGGADMLELGFPFSDPLADGPVIQGAAEASLRAGTRAAGFFRTVERIRGGTDAPLVLMTYANVLHRRGYARFVARAAEAGIDGIVVPDMPPEELEYRRAARGRLDTVFLAAPNTGPARMARIAAASSGFVYVVAAYGTTGGRSGVASHASAALRRARASTRLPVGVGFGISGPRDVEACVRAGADAVIVGSALIRSPDPGRLAGRLKAATR